MNIPDGPNTPGMYWVVLKTSVHTKSGIGIGSKTIFRLVYGRNITSIETGIGLIAGIVSQVPTRLV